MLYNPRRYVALADRTWFQFVEVVVALVFMWLLVGSPSAETIARTFYEVFKRGMDCGSPGCF
jgi:hypothetical protein